MKADQRDALLTKLYQLSDLKRYLDDRTAIKREEAERDKTRFREHRLWLADVDEKLSRAMRAMREAADAMNKYPSQNSEEEIEKLILNKTGIAIARSGNALQKAIDVVKHMQHSLAKGIHPEKRTDAEKKLVTQEPKGLKHTELPLSEKTKEIDTEFIRCVGSVLEKYHTKEGKPIPRREQIIACVFKSAFGEVRTEGSILKHLSPSRRQQRQPARFETSSSLRTIGN
jgi:hypothetical protein